MPHGEDTARDFCSYPFQGFDVDGRCCYLFEGAGNGNKPANGPSDARITVTTLDGGIVHWRLPVGACSDLEGLRALGLTDTGYAEAEGIKRKGDRLWLGGPTRRARFRTVISLLVGDEEHLFEGVVEGRIVERESGAEGFGYDPLFVPDGCDRTFAEMSPDEKNAVSHRGRAVRKLAAFLRARGEK